MKFALPNRAMLRLMRTAHAGLHRILTREDDHGDLCRAFEVHRSRNPQREGFPEAGRCLQANGEDVWSDGEGNFLDQGRYDVVTIVEAPDESSAMSLSLSLGALGNIRTESLRAFSAADMATIVGKMV